MHAPGFERAECAISVAQGGAMSRIRRLVEVVSALVFAIAIVIACLAISGNLATAQPSDEEPDTGPTKEVVPLDPFVPYTKDPGHWKYEDLEPHEKILTDKAAEWAEADHGPALHEAYRGAGRFGSQYAKLKRAERLAGLEGVGELGVE